jgi:DNA primase
MTISPRFMEELRNRLTLSDLIGRKVRLARAGREFKGCCPFHNEKTASFYVNDDKQFYHCFGCGAHGDAIGFAMQHDNLSFIEAIKELAGEAGMEVPQQSPQDVKKAEERKTLHSLMEEVTRWMESQLRAPTNKTAYRYITERGNSEEQLNNFRIGYAPADRQAMRQAMQAKGYDDAQMIEAGVLRAGKNGREPYAFFRERIMFPVPDRRGRVIAFGGRILPDHLRPPETGDYVPAKYMNSSETPLFNKGGMLYGEPRARQAALDDKPLIVVEGYVDVMACVKAGFDGAMAPMGTALTEDQIMVLWRMIPQASKVPILCFDGDNAGRRAAARACERILPLLKANHSARFAFLPDGQDPDSLINGVGKEAFAAIIENSMPLVEFLWTYHTTGQKFDTPEARAGLSKTLESEALKIPDREVQHYYRQAFREKVNKAFAQVYTPRSNNAGGRNFKKPYGKNYTAQNQGIVSIKRPRFMGEENKLLAAIINHPTIFDVFEEEIGFLSIKEPRIDALRQKIIELISEKANLTTENLVLELKNAGFMSELRVVLSDELYALARFARPQATYEDVCEGWRGLYQAIQQKQGSAENKRQS